MTDSPNYDIKPFPRARRLVTDVGRVVKGRPVIRGLLEIDVTEARTRIREHRARTDEQLSFTAYLATCAGRAIDEHRDIHACRDWLGRLVIFDDVDISTMIEVEKDGKRFPVGHIVRAANRKSLREILHITLDFDHDIVDGAPATRFAQTFAQIVESADALRGV